jgi:hypothetical protein
MSATNHRHYCSLKPRPTKPLPAGMKPGRTSLIQLLASKWLNGTSLKYCFMSKARFELEDGTWQFYEWAIDPAQAKAVRDAFDVWRNVGIGLTFQEIANPAAADIRIGFLKGAGSWSYVGRDIRNTAADELTMNLGWNVAQDIDTAVHEIGHTLGFPHEHQNPYAGIVWDEEAVYADLAKPRTNGTGRRPITTSSARSSRTRCKAPRGTRTRSCTTPSTRASSSSRLNTRTAFSQRAASRIATSSG